MSRRWSRPNRAYGGRHCITGQILRGRACDVSRDHGGSLLNRSWIPSQNRKRSRCRNRRETGCGIGAAWAGKVGRIQIQLISHDVTPL